MRCVMRAHTLRRRSIEGSVSLRIARPKSCNFSFVPSGADARWPQWRTQTQRNVRHVAVCTILREFAVDSMAPANATQPQSIVFHTTTRACALASIANSSPTQRQMCCILYHFRIRRRRFALCTMANSNATQRQNFCNLYPFGADLHFREFGLKNSKGELSPHARPCPPCETSVGGARILVWAWLGNLAAVCVGVCV